MNLFAKLKDSKTNWKYILIVVVMASIAGEGILGWQYLYTKKELAMKTRELANKSKEMEGLKQHTERLQKEIDLSKKAEEFETEKPKLDIANWKAYKNQRYGFEFKYPKEYDNYEACKIRETEIEANNWITIGEPALARFIMVIENSKGLNPLEYAAKEIAEVKVEPGWNEEWSINYPLWIDKEMGVKVLEHGGVRYSEYIFLSKADKIYEITFHSGISCLGYAGAAPEADTIPSELDIFEQIPFTFRFLQ
jgi:hypothetical protein